MGGPDVGLVVRSSRGSTDARQSTRNQGTTDGTLRPKSLVHIYVVNRNTNGQVFWTNINANKCLEQMKLLVSFHCTREYILSYHFLQVTMVQQYQRYTQNCEHIPSCIERVIYFLYIYTANGLFKPNLYVRKKRVSV